MTHLEVSAQPHDGGITRLALNGEIDLACAEQIADATDKALAGHPTEILIDLATVTFIDSTGMRTLLTAQRVAGEQGVSLRIIHANGVVARLLTMTGLLDVLEGRDRLT